MVAQFNAEGFAELEARTERHGERLDDVDERAERQGATLAHLVGRTEVNVAICLRIEKRLDLALEERRSPSSPHLENAVDAQALQQQIESSHAVLLGAIVASQAAHNQLAAAIGHAPDPRSEDASRRKGSGLAGEVSKLSAMRSRALLIVASCVTGAGGAIAILELLSKLAGHP